MNSEERFKKDLNELLGSKEFAFDEANWEKAKEMIDASKKTRRRPLAYFISGAVFVLSLLTGFYMLLDNETPVAITNAPPLKNKTITKPNSNSPQVNQTTDSKTHFQTAKAPVIRTEVKPNVPLTETSEPQVKTKDLALTNSEAQVVNVNPAQTKKSNMSMPSVTNATLSALLDVKENENETIPNIQPEITPEHPSKLIDQEPVAEEKSAPSLNLTLITTSETIAVGSTNEPTPLESATIATLAAVEGDVKELKNETTAVNNAETELGASLQEDNTASEIQPSLKNDSLLKESTAVSHPTIVAENTDPVYEGVEPEPKYQTIRFSIEAGTSYLYGWKNPKNRDANGFNPVFGLNCFNTFSPKLSFSFGLQYTTVNKLSYSNYTSKVIRLKLGEESEVSVYTPVKMHYVIFPLRLNYDFSVKNTLGFGCNAAYLVNLESELETYTEKPNSTEGYNLTKTYGYTQGFKKYDVQASVFYKRRLYPNLSANVEAFFGLTDIKDNDFFKLNAFERNAGVKLTLVYNILKK